MRSSTGATAWHGPHHSAQKSTMTLPSALEDLLLEGRVGCFDGHQFVRVLSSEVASRAVDDAAGGRSRFPRSVESKACSTRCPPSPTPTRSSSRSSSSGSARARSSSCASRTAAGPKWSFVDGPVTANKKLAVHTAWGRTLKDVFQRYKALRGFDQRYQNGFDCQGLWIEVGVERQLGPQLEARDRGVRARGVRAPLPRRRRQVVRGADARLEAARPVDGLGQRLLHLQRHEHRVHLAVPEDRPRARLALHRPPLDRVVPALRHVALAARADAVGRLPGEERPVALRPLPAARPARASRSSSGRRRRGRCRRTSPPPSTRRPSTGCARTASGSRVARYPDEHVRAARARARSSSGCATAGPFDDLAPGAAVEHRVVPWDEVSLEEGTGIVHIAHRLRRRGLRARPLARPAGADAGRRGRPLLRRLRLAARPLDGRGRRPDRRRPRRDAASSSRPGTYEHRYPHCWRCDTPLIFRHLRRLVHRASTAIREQLLEANATVEWVPGVHGQAHGRLAAQHGRLEHLAPPLLRPAAAVLPVLRAGT